MRAARLGFVALLVTLAIACGGGPTSTKYTQTWTKNYSATTCTDWNTSMNEHQKFVMAADFLLTFQKGDQADVAIPADTLINNFKADISTVCAGNTGFPPDQEKVGSIATLVYGQGGATYKP